MRQILSRNTPYFLTYAPYGSVPWQDSYLKWLIFQHWFVCPGDGGRQQHRDPPVHDHRQVRPQLDQGDPPPPARLHDKGCPHLLASTVFQLVVFAVTVVSIGTALALGSTMEVREHKFAPGFVSSFSSILDLLKSFVDMLVLEYRSRGSFKSIITVERPLKGQSPT